MDTAVALARGAHFLAVLSVLGASVFRVTIVRTALRGTDAAIWARVSRHQRAWLLASLAAALGLGVIWLAVQSAQIAGAAGFLDTMDAVPVVLTDTTFGHALTLRLALLVLTALAVPIGWLAAVLAAGAAADQIGMGHATAAGGFLLPVLVSLHVIAAGVWLGGLVPLGLLVRDLPGGRARVAALAFSPIGLSCVAVIAATALVQGVDLVGGPNGLRHSEYGHIAMLKIGLFAVLIALAGLNRLVLAPRADRAPGNLLRCLWGETVVGVAVVFAAAFLSQQMPGIDF